MKKLIKNIKQIIGIEPKQSYNLTSTIITPYHSNNIYNPNTCIGLQSGISSYSSLHSSINNLYWSNSSSTSTCYSTEYIREQRRKQLKMEVEKDTELLNEILTDLRKEKIEKIKSKGGF